METIIPLLTLGPIFLLIFIVTIADALDRKEVKLHSYKARVYSLEQWHEDYLTAELNGRSPDECVQLADLNKRLADINKRI